MARRRARVPGSRNIVRSSRGTSTHSACDTVAYAGPTSDGKLKMKSTAITICCALSLSTTLSACGGNDTVTEAAEPAGGAITLWTDSVELFMEHPALIVGAPDKFA